VVEFVNVGRTGLKVSRLGLGTMTFGGQIEESIAFAILDRAVDLGINFIDTADGYPVPVDPSTAGITEELLGRWLARQRRSLVIASKCGVEVGTGPNDRGGSRKHIIEACEASLRRLGLERLDILYLQHPDLGAPFEEAHEALDRLIQDGKIHYYGLSNFAAWQVGLFMASVGSRSALRPAVIQTQYSLIARGAERELLPLCEAAELGFVAYRPLASGMLTGKYKPGETAPPDSRFGWGDYGRTYQDRFWSEAKFELSDLVKEIAADMQVSAAQAALAWTLRNKNVVVPVVGASHPSHVDDCAKALAIQLSEKVQQRLAAASQQFL
jgi:1-deoxyxylulose-5-phosphate synthase